MVNGAPVLGMHDMVNQVTARGGPFVPAEAISIEAALRRLHRWVRLRCLRGGF